MLESDSKVSGLKGDMHWEKYVPTNFVSDSADSIFSEFGYMRSDYVSKSCATVTNIFC